MAWYPSNIEKKNNNDIGEIKAFMRITAPDGYLICNGSIYNIGDYPLLEELFTNEFGAVNYFGGNGTTTFAVPDLRGEFLRGTGTNGHSGQGSGSNVGIHKDATLHPFMFKWVDDVFYIRGKGGYDIPQGFDSAFTPSGITNNGRITINQTNTDSIIEETHYTSNPTSTSVLYCIRAY